MTSQLNHRCFERAADVFCERQESFEDAKIVAKTGKVFLTIVALLLAVTYGVISVAGTQEEIRASLHGKAAVQVYQTTPVKEKGPNASASGPLDVYSKLTETLSSHLFGRSFD
jgi:hypothetical protein